MYILFTSFFFFELVKKHTYTKVLIKFIRFTYFPFNTFVLFFRSMCLCMEYFFPIIQTKYGAYANKVISSAQEVLAF